MANVPYGGPHSHPNTQNVMLPRLAYSPMDLLPERSIDEWDAANTAERFIELDDEVRAHMTPEEYSESNARYAALLAQHEERTLAQYRALHHHQNSDASHESTNMRTRPLDSQFGSDGNQYNPYAPFTSEEFVLQEIEAGRMDPEIMDIPRHPSNPAQPPVSGNGHGPPLAHVHASGNISWMAPGHRPPFRQGLNGPGIPVNVPDPHGASWFQHLYDGNTAAEDLDEEERPDIYPALLPYLDMGALPVVPHGLYGTAPDPVSPNQDSPFEMQGTLTSSLDSPRLHELSPFDAPQQLHPASTRRERKRLAKPSLVVKLKTSSTQSLQAPVSPRRVTSAASSSSESSSAAQTTQRPFNLRSRGSTAISSTNARTRAGWDHQAVRKVTRRAEAVQSSHRKRRRDAVSPQDLSTEGITTPTAGLSEAPVSHVRRASTGTSEPQQRSILRADAPVFVPGLAATSERMSEEMTALEMLRLTIARQVDSQAKYVPSLPRPSSYLPPFRYLRTRRLVFTSELIPRSFGAQKRRDILNIFRTKAPYIPACINMALDMPSMQYHVYNEKSPTNSVPYHAPLGPDRLGWPKNSLPLEVFHNIAGHLSRDDLLQMRMVNSEFERKTSNIVFHTVVVPFRPEIYGMMIHDGPALDTKIDIKGKGKAKDIYGPVEPEKTVYDGMKVFQAWGPHIKKFAMAFDVEEDQLVKPPVKGKFEFFSEFWGKYRWPHPYYSRFDFCAGLEKKADEFRCMSAALSNLQGVRELGVSIDSGLGYLCGPDLSDHAQLFLEKPKIFGLSETQMSLRLFERQRLWDDIVRSLGPATATNYVIHGDVISADQTPLTPNEGGYFEVHLRLPSNPGSSFRAAGSPTNRGPHVMFVDANEGRPVDRPLLFEGINLANASHTGGATEPLGPVDLNTRDHASSQGREKSPFHTAALIPNNLTPAQKEWLLETEWAQRAFLSSYCMALTDNSHTFQHVQSFTVAKLSSRYLSALQREDFWRALPNLNTLTINVSADWRNILKSDSGVVEAPDIRPSGAATQFHKLLVTCIAVVTGIKTLSLGYFGGGEQQVGIFGRNKHILPAPLTDFTDHYAATSVNADILALPHVEHLTLTNCWITPPALKSFVAQMRAASLRTLTLDSVSLTAHSGVMDNMEPNPLENGVLRIPDGPPRRFGDPALGNLFQQRGSVPDPRSDGFGWMVESRRIGSWGNVIDAITPGPTVDLLRYAYQHLHDVPEMRDAGQLERINFVSCGYVKLVNMKDFNQGFLGEVYNGPPHYLRKRAIDLMPIMMQRNDDPLLGQIIPTLHDHELEVLQTAFPMEINRKDVTGWDNREDGQPIGGSGRFSGHVEKLIFPTEC